jgi:predicted HTH domain antitoxin
LINDGGGVIIYPEEKMQNSKQHSIIFNYPENLLLSLKLSEKEFEKEFKTAAVIKLYERGKISSGIASQLLQVSRVDFLNMLYDYKVSYFSDDIEEILKDMKNAGA